MPNWYNMLRSLSIWMQRFSRPRNQLKGKTEGKDIWMAQRNSVQVIMTNASFEDNETGQHNKTVVFFSFLGLMSIFIVAINCFVVFLVWKKKVLRTPANIFLTSLACADFFSGSCAIPLIIACQLLETRHSWSGPLCLSMDLISRMLSISSILHLLVIAVERYVVIVRHVKPDDFVSCKKYAVIVSALWLIPLSASFIQLTWIHIKDGVPQLRGISKSEIIYDLVCIFGFVVFPLTIIVIAYSKVFSVLRRHAKEIDKQTALFMASSRNQSHKLKEKRATFIYASMIVFYVIGWFPYFLLSLSYDLGVEEVLTIPYWTDTLFMFLRFLSPLVNPLLYTFFKQDFKDVIFSMRGGSKAHADTLLENSSQFDTIQLRHLGDSATSSEPLWIKWWVNIFPNACRGFRLSWRYGKLKVG